MSKLSRGAFSMVLVGAVTFSVTNALLVNQSSKNVADETAFTISEDQKKADGTHEKTVNDQEPTTNENDGQAIKGSINNNKSDMSEAVIQQNTKKSTEAMTIKPANVNTSTTPVHNNVTTTATPVATKIPEPSSKAPTTTTATPVLTTTEANTTSPTKTSINNGQQVSQDAKEKAASRQDNKENNGKNM